MIKAIIFDLDGTILDRTSSLKHFITMQHERWIDSDLLPLDTYRNQFLLYDQNGYVAKDVVYAKLGQEHDWEKTFENRLYYEYQEGFHDHCKPMQGLDRLIDFLQDSTLKCGLITNGQTDFQDRSIDALDIRHFFDSILISEREGLRKPSRELFHRALDQLQIQPDQALFVGDHPENDVEAARKVGMKTIWVKSEFYEAPESADFSVDTLSEIPGIINALNRRNDDENQ